MRAGVFDILRRGFDNTLVNWQVSLIRFLEAFLFIVIAVVTVLVLLVPIFLSIGIKVADLETPEDFENVLDLLANQWVMLIWIVVGVSVLLLVLMLIHSFIEAGCARVFVDGDHAAGPEWNGPRPRYAVFSMQRFLAGGREGWWTVFWIYNVIWGVGLLLILLPFAAVIAAAIVLGAGGNEAAQGCAVLLSCLGMVVTGMFSLAVMIVSIMWTNRAIVDWAVHRTTATGAVGYAGRSIRADLGRHVAVAVLIFVIAMAISMFFSTFGFLTGIGDSIGGALGRDGSNAFLLLTAPIRILMSLINSAISALIGSWFVASYAALANHR